VFPALALGTLMAVLDISVVNIALPTLSRSFGAPLTTIEWVVLAYVVTITGLLLAFGRLADMRGRRRVYGAGLALFTFASALCAAAPSAAWLIAARTLQGVGAAMMSANASALLVASFPPEERGRALGAFGAAVGVGLAMGPPLGGLIVGLLSWRWIFLVNLPVAALALWQLRTRVPADPPGRRDVALDLPSAALWFCALLALMLALSRGPVEGWGAPAVLAGFGLSAALFAGFAVLEWRSREPLLPLALLRGSLAVAAILTLVGQALSVTVGFHLPLYLEDVLGFEATHTGRWMATLPLTALFLAPLAGRLAERIDPRLLSAAGMLSAGAGFWSLHALGVEPDRLHILGGMALIGIGLGLFTVPNSTSMMGSVPAERLGLASGLQATMRNLGLAGGTAVTTAVVASRFAAHGGGRLAAGLESPAAREAFAHATRDLYLGVAVTAVAAAALAWFGPAAPHPRR
jgi:EmrB/QacA subfamily drug resistance transporter